MKSVGLDVKKNQVWRNYDEIIVKFYVVNIQQNIKLYLYTPKPFEIVRLSSEVSVCFL
jgi:hypothetical protein